MRELNDGLVWAPSLAKGFAPSRSLLILMKPLRRIRVEKRESPERPTPPRRRSIPHTRS